MSMLPKQKSPEIEIHCSHNGVVPLADLKPHPKNPNKHNERQVALLAKIIKHQGWRSPIVVSSRSGFIVAGHARLEAAKLLGLKDGPVNMQAFKNEKDELAHLIADNKIAELAEMDKSILKELLSGFGEFDMDLTGFDPKAFENLMKGWSKPGEDEAPELGEKPISKTGEIYQMGDHRLICGDCTDADTVTRLMDGAKPNLMVTDPPYGVKYDPQWRTRVNFDGCVRNGDYIKGDNIADWSPALELFSGDVAYVWHGGLHGAVVQAGIERIGFQIRAQIIWVKHMAGISRGHYSWQHEPCFYAVRKGKTGDWVGESYEPTVWEVRMLSPVGGSKDPADQDRTTHAAQKPVEVMRRPMTKHGQCGDIVYEPFMGSGTTLIAAETTRRVAYGCEIEPLYVDMAVKRWEAFTGKKAVKA